MINGVISEKLQLLDRTLGELRSLGQVSAADLESDWRTRRAIERDLQVLVEIMLDVCHRTLALEKETPASTSAQAIERCAELGVFASPRPYTQMAQFRNLVVHLYERVDASVLADVVNNQLGDFERFRDEVLRYADRGPTED